jgi:hypothetical protein
LRGYPAALIKKLKISLPEPSDMSAKRKLDIDEQKTRVIAAVQQLGLFSKDSIYREFYDMTDEEITRMTAEMEEQQQKEMQQQEQAAMAGPGPGEAGGQEPAENVPPTANEERGSELESLRDSVLEEDKKEVISRIIKKQQQKAETSTKK